MSQSALLLSTRDYIRANLIYRGFPLLNGMEVEVCADGRPQPGSGEFFISVHQGGWRGTSPEILYEVHSINITLTLKIARIPHDKYVDQIADLNYGLESIAHWLADNIHLNYQIMISANNLIFQNYGSQINVFVEPLRLSSVSPAHIVSGEWFHASPNQGETGLVQSLVFSDAVRVKLANQQPVVYDIDGQLL